MTPEYVSPKQRAKAAETGNAAEAATGKQKAGKAKLRSELPSSQISIHASDKFSLADVFRGAFSREGFFLWWSGASTGPSNSCERVDNSIAGAQRRP